MLRYGKPYFIKGAGGVSHLTQLKDCGGNSVRIWDDLDASAILDEAQKLGLTVFFGLWVERELEGFDYNNKTEVDKQYERIRKIVTKYRNHPALLMWCVGNEWAMEASNFQVYDEVNRLAELVHELDPDHPVATVISPDSERAIWLVQERCPALDVLGLNSYGLTEKLPQFLKKGGWDKPYLISEYGVQAYWETPVAPWKTPLEPTSQEKYKYVTNFYNRYIGSRPPNCLGAYLFYWGFKQEETHTWFNVFDEEGRETLLVEVMKLLWSGKESPNKAPDIQGIEIDGKLSTHQSYASGEVLHQARMISSDPEKDSLTYFWEIKRRAQFTADYSGASMPALKGLIENPTQPSISFKLPTKPGAYRLFAYAYDNHKHVASANFAFEVRAKESVTQ
ncbi:glycoside hydrolase family 2 TIM barrel-domain containing protein [Spirosoma harenae]